MISVPSLQVHNIVHIIIIANLHLLIACISIGYWLSGDGKIAVASSLITFVISFSSLDISVITIVKNKNRFRLSL